MNSTTPETFFTKDKQFYKALFSMLAIVSLQNLVAYSVNMTDNIMLGSYNQNALSGAAIVNQIFFIVQQLTMSIGNALVILTSQYWGQQKPEPIRELTGVALKAGLFLGTLMFCICSFFAEPILYLFTTSPAIVQQASAYLGLIKWTFFLFIITNTLICSLRSVGTVKIAFYTSLLSLAVNFCINYVLIFGRFGLPELGITGAGIGTVVARIMELLAVVVYLLKTDKKIHMFCDKHLLQPRAFLAADYRRVVLPMLLSQILWCMSVPIQTAILGHLSDDAIAANSVATTFFQYLKVIVIALSSTSSVLIGNAIGRGNMSRIRSDARTLATADITLGILLALILYSLRYPLLSLYNLSANATALAINLIALMSAVMVGMSFQMPVMVGILQGSGDVRFAVVTNLISMWLIVMPLSFLSAFVWHWPIELVVLMIQSDQFFKCIPIFWRLRSYKWIHRLTK